MIIDDDFDNLRLTKDVLQLNSFETYDFINPHVAIKVFKQSPRLFDLVIMDVKLQEMDGQSLYKEIKQIRPDVKVLVFTGMVLNVDEFKKICPSFDERQVIQKPVRMSSLVRTVNEAMMSV
jgi:DNA-binding NtrC family response regulator